MNIFFQVVILFSGLCLLLVSFIDQGNEIIELRAALPKLEKELKEKKREIVRLNYEISQQENPVHLMECLQKPEFGTFRFPYDDEVIVVEWE